MLLQQHPRKRKMERKERMEETTCPARGSPLLLVLLLPWSHLQLTGLKANLDLKHELGAKFKLVPLTMKLYDFYEPRNFTLWKACKDFSGTRATFCRQPKTV
jgi:hypothetical protein